MTTLRKEAVHYLEAQRTATPYYKVTPQEARAMRTVTQWQSVHKPKLASIENYNITVRDGRKLQYGFIRPSSAKLYLLLFITMVEAGFMAI